MEQEGIDPTIIEKQPDEMISLENKTDEKKVAVSEHPLYSKYFKMLKVLSLQ